MSTIDVSLALLPDLAELAPLFDAYRVFYGQRPDLAGSSAFLADRLAARDSVIFLARLDGRAAGFVQLYPSFSSVSANRIYVLNDLYVAASARRAGVGGALMDAAERMARERGAIRLVLTTERTNLTAQSLYERIGYTRDEVFLIYEKQLTPAQ